MKFFKMALCASLAAGLFLTGCGSEKEEKPVEKKEEYAFVLGNKKESSYEVHLKNKTGSDIVSMQIREDGETEYSDNLLKEDEIFKNKDVIQWFFKEEKTEKNDTEKELQKMYNLKLTLEDETTIELFCVNFKDASGNVSLMYEDGLGFITYKSKESKEKISTKEQESNYYEKAKQSEAETAPEETPTEEVPMESVPVIPEQNDGGGCLDGDVIVVPDQNDGGGCLGGDVIIQ